MRWLVDGVPIPGGITSVTPDEGASGRGKDKSMERIQPEARVRVRSSSPKSGDLRKLHDVLQTGAESLAECSLVAPRESYRVHRMLRLRNVRSSSGGSGRFEVETTEGLPPMTAACLREVVESAADAAFPPEGSGVGFFEIKISVWMNF